MGMTAVAAYFVTLRKQQNITRSGLAKRIGTTEMTILRIEEEGQEPRAELLAALANALNAEWDVVQGLLLGEMTLDGVKATLAAEPSRDQMCQLIQSLPDKDLNLLIDLAERLKRH